MGLACLFVPCPCMTRSGWYQRSASINFGFCSRPSGEGDDLSSKVHLEPGGPLADEETKKHAAPRSPS